MKTFVLLFLTVFSANISICQNTISGHLFDENKEFIPYVKISITETNKNSRIICSSGFQGEFLIDSLPSGLYTIKFEKVGYKHHSFEFTLNGDTTINSTLAPTPQDLGEIKVVDHTFPLVDKGDEPFENKISKNCDLDTLQREGKLAPMEVKKFLINYLQYPSYSVAQMEQGRVSALFKIDSLGKIRDIQITKGVSECLDNKVISALQCISEVVMLKKMPNGRYDFDGMNGFKEGEYTLHVRFLLK